jgi:hypothetical protein
LTETAPALLQKAATITIANAYGKKKAVAKLGRGWRRGRRDTSRLAHPLFYTSHLFDAVVKKLPSGKLAIFYTAPALGLPYVVQLPVQCAVRVGTWGVFQRAVVLALWGDAHALHHLRSLTSAKGRTLGAVKHVSAGRQTHPKS